MPGSMSSLSKQALLLCPKRKHIKVVVRRGYEMPMKRDIAGGMYHQLKVS